MSRIVDLLGAAFVLCLFSVIGFWTPIVCFRVMRAIITNLLWMPKP